MKQSDERLILESTDGAFSRLEVPQLYVEIQKQRAKLEKEICFQISFSDALKTWKDEIYSPIMSGIISSRVMQRSKDGKTLSEVYFDIYDMAEEGDFRDIPGCVRSYSNQHPGVIRRFLSSLSA